MVRPLTMNFIAFKVRSVGVRKFTDFAAQGQSNFAFCHTSPPPPPPTYLLDNRKGMGYGKMQNCTGPCALQ